MKIKKVFIKIHDASDISRLYTFIVNIYFALFEIYFLPLHSINNEEDQKLKSREHRKARSYNENIFNRSG